MSKVEAAKARCPFYRSSGRKGCYIRCEGIACARSVTITYRGERQRARQMEVFCRDAYARCEIYRAIAESKGLDEEGDLHFTRNKLTGDKKYKKGGKP